MTIPNRRSYQTVLRFVEASMLTKIVIEIGQCMFDFLIDVAVSST